MIKFVTKRKLVHGIIGTGLFIAVFYFKVSLLYILIAGAFLGIIFGKVFCRWMCPMGFIMELLTKSRSDSLQQMYNYHKLGCPIAWISGFFNRFSLFNIKRDENKCTECGICDSNCYISTLDKKYSLYKSDAKNPSVQYSCSKCLECVKNCPTKSLKYKI